MKEIKLTQGLVAKVNDEDFEEMDKHRWYAAKDGNTFYARRRDPLDRAKYIKMHRAIMQTIDGMETDHKDHDGLNNQKENLRNCTHHQNMMNRRLRCDSTSKTRGVCWHKTTKKWQTRIGINGELKHLGLFNRIEDAAKAYNEAAKEYFGDFALLTAGE